MVGLFVVLSVSTYARPSALLVLRPEWIVPPMSGHRWSLLLNPPEGKRPSKTGEWDASVTLDSKWLGFLAPVLRKLKETRPRGTPVWGFGYPTYLEQFKAAAASLCITALTPYQTRHSGASIDRFNEWRDLASVKKRGGWRSDRSVARYEKSARLGYQQALRGTALVEHGKSCLAALEGILVHGRTLPAPRIAARN